jgi:hypothetical protein
VPKNDYVKIVVYNLSGKAIETLVDDNLPAGTYETTFSAMNISSGIYYYRLTGNKFIETKKMIVVK